MLILRSFSCFLSLILCVILTGQVDAAEIQQSLRAIGVDISLDDATRILQRSDNSMLISDITSH